MTCEEFNEKYKEYLEYRHYGLALDNSEVIEYLDMKFQEFIKIPGFTYSQIKMKYDFACFYCNGLTIDEISEVEKQIEMIYKS